MPLVGVPSYRYTRLCQRPTVGEANVAQPAAAQVVSWAASPYYAAPGKIKSVHDAIVRVLGFDLVLNLALGLALGRSLSLPKHIEGQYNT